MTTPHASNWARVHEYVTKGKICLPDPPTLSILLSTFHTRIPTSFPNLRNHPLPNPPTLTSTTLGKGLALLLLGAKLNRCDCRLCKHRFSVLETLCDSRRQLHLVLLSGMSNLPDYIFTIKPSSLSPMRSALTPEPEPSFGLPQSGKWSLRQHWPSRGGMSLTQAFLFRLNRSSFN